MAVTCIIVLPSVPNQTSVPSPTIDFIYSTIAFFWSSFIPAAAACFSIVFSRSHFRLTELNSKPPCFFAFSLTTGSDFSTVPYIEPTFNSLNSFNWASTALAGLSNFVTTRPLAGMLPALIWDLGPAAASSSIRFLMALPSLLSGSVNP